MPIQAISGPLPNLPGITLYDGGDYNNIPVGSIVETAAGRRYRVEGHAAAGHRGAINVTRSAEAAVEGWRVDFSALLQQNTPNAIEEDPGPEDPGPDYFINADGNPELRCLDPMCTTCGGPRGAAPQPTRPAADVPRGPFDRLRSWIPQRDPIKRVFFSADLSDPEDRVVQKRKRVPEKNANLVSSLVDNGDRDTSMHAPVLDIDFPCRLVPSSTEGHFHLYIDKEITWERYALLLNALWRAGIIEEGFYRMSMKREATFVRKPNVQKAEGDISSSSEEHWLVR